MECIIKKINIAKDYAKSFFRELANDVKVMKKPFLILTFIYVVAISAILRANFNYIDDIGRIVHGYKGWENFSRYTSNFLSGFIHADNYLTDISPLSQIIAVMMIAFASVIVIKIISKKEKFSFFSFVAVLPLALSPYFLECLSYKFDSPYMALSILASVLPLLFYKKNKIIYFVAIFLCMLVVCTTYQPASGIFPMFVILLSMKMWHDKEELKDILKFILVSILGYVSSLLIFYLFIMQSINNYVSNSVDFNGHFILNVINNLKHYYQVIQSDFKNIWLICIGIMCVLFVIIAVRDSKRKKHFAFIGSMSALILMILLIFGIYPILSNPLYEPRAMYGFGAFIAFIGVYIVSAEKTYISKVVCLILSWGFFVFAFTYGNALYAQNDYADFRISSVISDLNSLEQFKTGNVKNVQISGSIGYSPVIKNMPQDYQILNRLIPINFREKWSWGKNRFCYYYNIKNIYCYNSLDLTKEDLPVLKDTMYHTIKGNDNYILIELH